MSQSKRNEIIAGVRIMFREVWTYRAETTLLSALGMISAVANGAVPYLVGLFFDALLNITATLDNTTVPLWIALLALWFAVQLLANGIDWIIGRKRDALTGKLHGTWLAKRLSALLILPIGFHKEQRIGEVTDTVNRAAGQLERMLNNVINFLPQILSVLVGIGFVLWIHPLFAIIIAAGLIMYVGILIPTVRPLAHLSRKGIKAWRKAYGDAYDAMLNTQTIKQAVAEHYEQKRIMRAFTKAFTTWLRTEHVWSNIRFQQRVVVIGTQLSIFLVSVVLITNARITIGELIALNGYAAMVFGPFTIIAQNWQTIQNGAISLVAAERIHETTPEDYAPRNKEVPEQFSGDILFENVSFGYDDKKHVLHSLSFDIRDGEKVALVGESGVGKSTAIELISGYYFPTKGSVFVSGIDTKNHDIKTLRSHISIVPQEPVLFNDTVEKNIKYGSFKRSNREVINAAKEAHAHEFIKAFPDKYSQKVGERGIKLSVGQKQRIAIARAILRDPHILILDEPTSALDAKTEHAITDSLEKLMRGRTTLIIAHRLSTVRTADKIIVFEKGRVVETGTHEELLTIENGVYKRLYEYQIGLH